MSNIQKFHERLESMGIPIHGVSSKGDPIRIDFKDEATQEQRDKALLEWSIMQKRSEAEEARENKISNTIATGFTNNGTTYSLTSTSLDNWQKLATTLRAEIDASITDVDDIVPVFDINNTPVTTMTAGEVQTLLANIGKTARLLQTQDIAWQAQIAAASTEAELDAIIVDIEG